MMMMPNVFISLFIFPIIMAIPAIILYFIIKLAVKNAIKESRDDGFLK